MGLSSSKSTNDPSKFAKPYIANAANSLQGVYNANQPGLQQISNTLGSQFSGYSDYLNKNPTLEAAQGRVQDVLGGKYLNGNPQIQNIIDQTNSSVQDRIASLFSRAGQTGSSRQIGELGKQLAENEARLRYQNYNTEQDRIDNAVGQAAGLNSQVNQNYQTSAGLGQIAAGVPYTGVNNLVSGTAGLLGQYQTKTSNPSLISSIGQGIGALGAVGYFSDRRLKTNIERIGEFADGLGRYAFDYIWGGGRQEGVMADEVAKLRPWALGPVVAGFATVNYKALSDENLASLDAL